MAVNLSEVKYSDLDGKFVILKDVASSGDLYNDYGAGPLIFGITNNNVYRLDIDNLSDIDEADFDITKYTLVLTSDTTNKKIQWTQGHDEALLYEAINSLQQDTYTGDLGLPLLQALDKHIRNTYAIVSYDYYIADLPTLANHVISNSWGSLVTPTNVTTTATADGASISAQ